ncbi:MAG TPA: DUF1778 domain-containing protein [Armatimonadota bacterium]|nr:DUF1778 domain-containing protein [Armatimonadota bacterium]
MDRMDREVNSKEQREHLHVRLAADMKRRVEDAASIRGQTVTDFVKAAVLARADEVLQHEQRLALSEESMRQFLAALDNPPEPNEKLKRLMVR